MTLFATVSGMSNRSHLTPTVITDKNGKTTTVRKKQPSVQGAPSTIPAPAIGTAPQPAKRQRRQLSEEELEVKKAAERKRLINKTIKSLYKDDRIRQVEPYKSSEISGCISYFQNNGYLRDMAVVADLVTRNELTPQEFDEDRNALVYDIRWRYLQPNHFAEVRSVAHYSDWMREKNVRYKDFMRTRGAVCAAWADRNTKDGIVKNLEAHYTAMTQIDAAAFTTPYRRGNPITEAVDNHPEHINHLVAYINERGIAAYTEEAFREYMSAASNSLREGWV